MILNTFDRGLKRSTDYIVQFKKSDWNFKEMLDRGGRDILE